MIEAEYTVIFRAPRGWQSDDGTWVDMAEYAIDSDDKLVRTSDWVIDPVIMDVADGEIGVGFVEGNGILPDWDKAEATDTVHNKIDRVARLALDTLRS